MRLKNKKVLVYGLGISGNATINFLIKKQAKIFFYDDNKEILSNFKNDKVTKFELLKHLKKLDIVLIAPGVYNSNYIKIFEVLKIKIINEIELASCFVKKSKIIAITGTNGKTTTTKMIESLLLRAGKKATACGNIGVSFLDNIDKDENNHFFVVELSTFQLEKIKKFKPNISILLNISPNHLDRHKDFLEYQTLKFQIAKNQIKTDYFLFNADIEEKFEKYKNIKAKKLVFGNEKSAIYLKDEKIYLFEKEYITLKALKLSSNEILENYFAVILLGNLLNIEKDTIIETILNYKPEKHRLEFIGNFKGVNYINDSKSTTPASTIFALKKLDKKNIILLLGGHSKNLNLEEIFKYSNYLKQVICFGQAREQAFLAGKQSGYNNLIKEKTLLLAVKKARLLAIEGDTVLLSPACASFDEFKDYKERGELFGRFVNAEYKDTK